MQYIEVAVNTKTSLDRQTFTYAIPPEILPEIKPGVLVFVPFRNKKLHGIILSIQKFSHLARSNKLKNVISIINPFPLLNPKQIELAKWISDYYLAPLGKVIFAMIPPIAQRLAKLEIALQKNIVANNRNNEIQGKTYAIYERIDNRINHYLKLVRKVLAVDKQVIILFPKISLGSQIVKKIQEEFQQINIAILHTGLTKTQRFQTWMDIKNQRKKIVVGSRSTVFAPCTNLGLIIIDQPEDFGYKEEQIPRYNAVDVAKKISQILKIKIIFGALKPSVENYFFLSQKKILTLKSTIGNTNYPEIDLIDSSTDKGIISWKLEEQLNNSFREKQRVLLFSFKKGMASAIYCRDCSNVLLCPKCNLPYRYFIEPTPHLICHKCNVKISLPYVCPICRGNKFNEYGIGDETINKEIKKIFPQASNRKNTTIATRKILNNNINFDITAVISPDSVLNLPDFSITENMYLTLVELISKTSKKFIIQTHNPNHFIFQSIKLNNPSIFYQKELTDRKNLKYPPFYKIIRIIAKSFNKNQCEEDLTMFRSKLLNQINQKFTAISPVHSCFYAKKQNKFYNQIIIKTKNPDLIKKIIRDVRISKNIYIDVDPISLL